MGIFKVYLCKTMEGLKNVIVGLSYTCTTSAFPQKTFWCLYQLVQAMQVRKLQAWPARSKFWQVGDSNLFYSPLGSVHSICVIQSQPIYFLNMPWEAEWIFVCLHLLSLPLTMTVAIPYFGCIEVFKVFLSWGFYSICTLDLVASHNSSVSLHKHSQSQDPQSGGTCQHLSHLSASGKGAERPEKAKRKL